MVDRAMYLLNNEKVKIWCCQNDEVGQESLMVNICNIFFNLIEVKSINLQQNGNTYKIEGIKISKGYLGTC